MSHLNEYQEYLCMFDLNPKLKNKDLLGPQEPLLLCYFHYPLNYF